MMDDECLNALEQLRKSQKLLSKDNIALQQRIILEDNSRRRQLAQDAANATNKRTSSDEQNSTRSDAPSRSRHPAFAEQKSVQGRVSRIDKGGGVPAKMEALEVFWSKKKLIDKYGKGNSNTKRHFPKYVQVSEPALKTEKAALQWASAKHGCIFSYLDQSDKFRKRFVCVEDLYCAKVIVLKGSIAPVECAPCSADGTNGTGSQPWVLKYGRVIIYTAGGLLEGHTINTGRVTTNTGRVTTNTGRVTTNTGRVTIDTTKRITTNTGRVTNNIGRVTINTGNVTTTNIGRNITNTGRITTNTGRVTTNTGRVTTSPFSNAIATHHHSEMP